MWRDPVFIIDFPDFLEDKAMISSEGPIFYVCLQTEHGDSRLVFHGRSSDSVKAKHLTFQIHPYKSANTVCHIQRSVTGFREDKHLKIGFSPHIFLD